MMYKHIINLPHHVSKKHLPMPMTGRAAQFFSFKALTGFEDEIEEASRYVDTRPELTEDKLENLNQIFRLLSEIGSKKPDIFVKYFVLDKLKKGGKYATATGKFRFLDMGIRILKFTDGTSVPIDDIVELKFFRTLGYDGIC